MGTCSSRTSKLCAIAAVAGAVFTATEARAAVTIGSDLSPDPVNAGTCLGTAPCTTVTTIPLTQNVAPIPGVVVRWRVRARNAPTSTTPIALRLMQPLGGTTYLAKRTSSTELFADALLTTRTYLTRLSIAVGDQLGLDVSPPSNGFIVNAAAAPAVTVMRWQPPLADGTSAPATQVFMNSNELMVNADIEPDADGDGFGDESQDLCLAQVGPSFGCATAVVTKKCKRRAKKKRGKGSAAAAVKKKKSCGKKKGRKKKK